MPCFLRTLARSRERQRQLALLVFIYMVIIIILVLVFSLGLDDYGQWEGLDSHRCDEYCENSHECDHEIEDRPLVQQPVNTWTNLAFIFLGFIPIVFLRVDVGTIAYLLAHIYGGIGSLMFHASVSTYWQHIDVAGVYTMFLSLIFHGVHAITGISWNVLGALLLALGITFAFVKTDMDDANLGSTNMVIILTVIIVIQNLVLVGAWIHVLHQRQDDTPRMKLQKGLKIVLVAAFPGVLFFLANVLRGKDRNKSWCMPDSVFQGHGAWHCLSAIADLMIWLFFDRNRLKDILALARGEDGDQMPSKLEDLEFTDETWENKTVKVKPDLADDNSEGHQDPKERS